MCVFVCARKRVQCEFRGAHNGRRREAETEKERGRPASKSPDLHEKKHDAVLLLTSAAGRKNGCLLFTDYFSSTHPKLHDHWTIFSMRLQPLFPLGVSVSIKQKPQNTNPEMIFVFP